MSFYNFILFTLLAIISSCAQEGADSSLVVNNSSNALAPTLSSIRVFCSEQNIQTGTTCDLTTLGYMSNGLVSNISDEVEYVVEVDSTLIEEDGVVTAVSSGSSKVTASIDGLSADVTILTFTANITQVKINKNSLTLSSDGQYRLEAFALYDNGFSRNISTIGLWESDDPTVLAVDSGNVTSLSQGTSNVSVEYEGFSDSIITTVTAETISSLQVTPIIGSGSLGIEQQFYATAILSDGSTQDFTQNVIWESSDSNLLSIAENGLASLLGVGEVSVSARYGGLTVTVDFSIISKVINSLSIQSDSDSLSVNSSLNLKCIATYDDGSEEDISDSALWSVDSSSKAFIADESLLLTPIEKGVVTVTAALSGINTSKTITITDSSLDSISLSPSSIMLSSEIDTRLRAFGNYSDGTSVDITHLVTWSTSDITLGIISNINSSKGYFTNSYTGSTIDSLNFTASLGGITQTGNIIITPGSISSISISQSDTSINTNQNFNLRSYAHFADGASVDITDLVTWSSSDESVVFISNSIESSGLLSSLSEGTSNIYAYYKGFNSQNVLVNVSDTDEEYSSDLGVGLTASYFTGNNFDVLQGKRIDSTINFNWATGQAPLGVGDNFSVRWTGKIMGKISGMCTITSRSDDGFRLYIDGVSIIDVWFPHAPRWDSTHNVPFVEGEKQDITVEFFENGGHAVAELYWECDGDSVQEIIPKEYLFSE